MLLFFDYLCFRDIVKLGVEGIVVGMKMELKVFDFGEDLLGLVYLVLVELVEVLYFYFRLFFRL